MTVAQELTPMTPKSIKNMHNTAGEIWQFPGGWGGLRLRSKKKGKGNGNVRGEEFRHYLLNMMERGKPYGIKELFKMQSSVTVMQSLFHHLKHMVETGELTSYRETKGRGKPMKYIKP